MAEIILPPEENEETPQAPELNIDKPTENSKVITIEFEAKKTNKVSTKDTNQQLYTTDTDAWFEFKETSLGGANGTYSVVFRNRHDGSIFQRTGDVVGSVAYYKIPHQEIRHAGAWRGQVVYTLSNGDTTAREFDYDVQGHILDGKDVREIVVEDFETLMSQLRSMKDSAEQELAGLTQELENTTDTAEQNETNRQAFFDDLVEDIDGLQANYQELLDTGVLQTNINTKLEALEEEYAPKLTEVTAQLAQKANKTELNAVSSQVDNLVAHAGDTDDNSELLDIRVSSSGVVHDTAGTSVRKQIQKAYKMADEGKKIETKEMVIEKYSNLSDTSLPDLEKILGKNINEEGYWVNGVSKNFLIDVLGHTEITFPVFKATGSYGVLFTDVDGTVIKTYSEKTLATGSMKVLSVPPKASAFLLVMNKALYETDWHIELNTDINQRLSSVEAKPIKLNKDALIGSYENIGNDFYDAENSLGVHFDELDGYRGAPATYMIDVSEFVAIEYSVFKTSSGYGSLILNDDGIVIWSYAETEADTGSLKEVVLPTGSKTFVYAISGNLSSEPYELNLYKNYKPKTLQKNLYPEPTFEDGSATTNDLALCSMVTKYKKDKKPFHEGYLFHRLKPGDESLYYGERMDDLEKIGEVDFNTNNSMLAISPKDKRVVATERGVKSELYVWDGETTHVLFNDVTGPKGWLYNSGVDFIEDENGDEYCIFAEYGGGVIVQTGGFYVWRGKFPYTSESDWEKVLFQDFGGEGIDHFHMVRKDPWTNIIYLTSGDSNPQSKWWYSEDDGKTWTMFARGSTSGLEEHLMRCINFIFTEDYVYWAVDHGRNHSLNRIKRNAESGILDLSTREKLTDLPDGQATNSITYSHYPEGIFMFDRWDYGPQFEEYFHLPIEVLFWDIEREELVKVVDAKRRYSAWGGHRGQAYINYTNPYNPYPTIGFSDDTRNPFEVPVTSPSQVGSIYYDISEGLMKFLS